MKICVWFSKIHFETVSAFPGIHLVETTGCKEIAQGTYKKLAKVRIIPGDLEAKKSQSRNQES